MFTQPSTMAGAGKNCARGLFIAALAVVAAGCSAPPSFQAVTQPRSGKPIGRVAVVYSCNYEISLGGFERLHSFDIHKYAKIYLQLVCDGLVAPEDVFVPAEAREEQIVQVHTAEFQKSLKDPKTVSQYLELPLLSISSAGAIDREILRPFRYAVGGTIEAARQARKSGIAINLAGGYHHAKPDCGGGFCIYNDMAIAIRTLQLKGIVQRAMVVDLDAHQGNGTAVCFALDDRVYTFDMHQGNIYPIPKETCSQDVPLSSRITDAEYLQTLKTRLPRAMDTAKPDIVFLQAGCDVLAGDPLASLSLTPEGLARRDAMVVAECVRRKIPVVMVLGGGYSKQAWAAQYGSIRGILLKYGISAPARRPRTATLAEKAFAG